MARKTPRIVNPISREFLEGPPPRFKPYVFIETVLRIPTSIAMAAAAGGGMKFIKLWEGATTDDLPRVQTVVRQHYVDAKGGVPLFGQVLRYRFIHDTHGSIVLDIDGNEIARQQ